MIIFRLILIGLGYLFWFDVRDLLNMVSGRDGIWESMIIE